MKINISIDDVTPHPQSPIDVTDICFRVLDKHPDIKFTFFIPTAYWRTIPAPPESMCQRPLKISEYPKFCDSLRQLPVESFEFCFHGHNHGITGRSNNDELQNVTYSQALSIFESMLFEVSEAGLDDRFRRVLRPPAWRMSPGAFEAATKLGFTALALSPREYARSTYNGRDVALPWSGKVIYYDAAPPDEPLVVKEKLEVVYHACRWDRNVFDDKKAQELIAFLSQNSYEACFIEGLL